MDQRTKKIGVVLGIVAMVLFALPICYWAYVNAANGAVLEEAKARVAQHPELQPVLDQAMEDKVLSVAEAKDIIARAGKIAGPKE